MSSKFLSAGGSTAEVIRLLNAGTETLNVSSIIDQSLIPNLPVCSNTTKSLIGRLIQTGDLGFSILSNPMVTDLDLGNNDIINVNQINGITITNFVSGPASSVSTRLASYNGITGKLLQDSGLLTADIFLKNGSVAMTGDLNMNVHEIKGLVAIRPNDSNFVAGNTTSLGLGATGNVLIGDFTTSTGSYCIGIGLQCIVRNLAVVIGKEAIGGVLSTIIGYRSSNGSNTDTIIIGHDNVSSGGANADIFGVNRTNNQANSLLLGNGSYINIRANTTCDLGTVAVPFNSIYANGNLVSAGSSKSIDNIVSTASTGVSGNVTTFSAGKVVQDSGIALSSLATTASLATYVQGPASSISTNLASYNGVTGKLIQDSGLLTADVFLRTGAIAMTGALNMNANNITNVGIITTNTATVNVGNTNTTFSVGDIYVGSNNTAPVGGEISIVYGNANNLSGSTNGQSIVYGNNNSDSNTAGGSFIFGFGNTNGTGQRNVLIGRNNVVPNAINEGFCIGFALTNSISNSLLVGNSVNWRSNNNNVCNLGVLTTNQFKTLFAQSFDSSGAITIAPTSATSLALGRVGITTTTNGTSVMTVPYGAWYSSANSSIGFTANTNKLTPPTTSSVGILSLFTYAAGVLTFTSAKSRVVKINYIITFTMPNNALTTMTFFNSVNGSTVLGTTQTSAKSQSYTATLGSNTQLVTVSFSDIISLNVNDTIQLAGACSASTTIVYNLISCNVISLLN